MVTAELLFSEANQAELQHTVLCGSYALPIKVSQDLEDFLEWLLAWDTSQRPMVAMARGTLGFSPAQWKTRKTK